MLWKLWQVLVCLALFTYPATADSGKEKAKPKASQSRESAERYRPKDSRDAFTAADRNQDGVITRNEWFFSAESFDRIDLDRDGRITREEFRKHKQR